MEKIMTRAQKEKKVKRNQLIIGIVLILLMVFSTLGYALSGNSDSDSSEELEYNGITFIKDSEFWIFVLDNNEFITRYNPQEVEDIFIFSDLSLGSYIDKPLYFEGVGEPVFEITRNLDDRFVLRIQNACIDEDCEEDWPIKNCSIDNVIVIKDLKEDELESIYQDENCIIITANYSNQIKYADVFLFNTLGI